MAKCGLRAPGRPVIYRNCSVQELTVLIRQRGLILVPKDEDKGKPCRNFMIAALCKADESRCRFMELPHKVRRLIYEYLKPLSADQGTDMRPWPTIALANRKINSEVKRYLYKYKIDFEVRANPEKLTQKMSINDQRISLQRFNVGSRGCIPWPELMLHVHKLSIYIDIDFQGDGQLDLIHIRKINHALYDLYFFGLGKSMWHEIKVDLKCQKIDTARLKFFLYPLIMIANEHSNVPLNTRWLKLSTNLSNNVVESIKYESYYAQHFIVFWSRETATRPFCKIKELRDDTLKLEEFANDWLDHDPPHWPVVTYETSVKSIVERSDLLFTPDEHVRLCDALGYWEGDFTHRAIQFRYYLDYALRFVKDVLDRRMKSLQ
ncbi:hypothetical protein HII31_03979 [Pseudocercospora fuligena]|uniref:Uncharacterized protein n=1 Tax=Pseudocercospora fuligena TaxID=685502 RepID=A0A8H6RPB9_9PEZI|nr:hypothetical protein HII31_03979 [Pseudocercospora fuligena]